MERIGNAGLACLLLELHETGPFRREDHRRTYRGETLSPKRLKIKDIQCDQGILVDGAPIAVSRAEGPAAGLTENLRQKERLRARAATWGQCRPR